MTSPTTPRRRGGAELLRAIGLLADGPVRWGAPVAARGPGLYVVELPGPLPDAPVELTRVGKWLERTPGLRLDGARESSKAVAARLASLWLPDAAVLYAGATERSIGGRVAALVAHVPGDRAPHADGQWLHLLRGLESLRIWWAATDAPEEYLDAFFDAFAGEAGPGLPDRPSGALALPWANMRRPTGERQAHGIAGAIAPAEPSTPPPPTRVVELPPGDAEGARREERGTGIVRRAPTTAGAARPTPVRVAASRAPRPARSASLAGKARPAAPPPVELSAEALDRLRVELDELTRVKRPEVVHRIKTARELGDLRENADYTAAREEQSFLEGRIQALEDRLRRAVVVDNVQAGRAVLGSVVAVEHDGEELEYALVGTTEADPRNGRISTASPVGAALLGAVAGAEVEVRTPRGVTRYRVLRVS